MMLTKPGDFLLQRRKVCRELLVNQLNTLVPYVRLLLSNTFFFLRTHVIIFYLFPPVELKAFSLQ